METAEVIVAGGGIIGLSTALELVRHGFQVRVLEKGRAMSEASWAAAGMLSPHDPTHPPELAQLAALSIRLYPEYLSTVEGLSGRSVRLRTQAAISTEEGEKTGVALSAQEAQSRVPGLATEGRSFRWVEEVSLDPRDLCAALPLAVAAAGAVLQEDTEVLSVRSQVNSVDIATSQGTMTSGSFVNCSGAWAARIQHTDLQRPPAAGVEPWKGQILTVRVEPPLDLAYVLRSPEVYLVPRGGGNIVIGATSLSDAPGQVQTFDRNGKLVDVFEPGPGKMCTNVALRVDMTLPPGMSLDQYEQELIRNALKQANNNKSQAARILGLTRNSLRYRLTQMGIES